MPAYPTKPEGGPAQSVLVVTDIEVEGGVAIPVYGWTGQPTDGRLIEGGPSIRVKVITTADLRENGGKYQLMGMPFAMPVSGTSTTPGAVEGGIAIAVFPVNAWP